MANVEHSALTGSDLHEPKGVSTAASNTVYVANGAGSGSWSPTQLVFTGEIPDLNTSDTIYIPVPYAGSVVKFHITLDSSFSFSGSNPVVTIQNSGGTAMTNGSITTNAGASAAGLTYAATPTALNTVSADSHVRINTSGGGTGPTKVWFSFVLERS